MHCLYDYSFIYYHYIIIHFIYIYYYYIIIALTDNKGFVFRSGVLAAVEQLQCKSGVSNLVSTEEKTSYQICFLKNKNTSTANLHAYMSSCMDQSSASILFYVSKQSWK